MRLEILTIGPAFAISVKNEAAAEERYGQTASSGLVRPPRYADRISSLAHNA